MHQLILTSTHSSTLATPLTVTSSSTEMEPTLPHKTTMPTLETLSTASWSPSRSPGWSSAGKSSSSAASLPAASSASPASILFPDHSSSKKLLPSRSAQA